MIHKTCSGQRWAQLLVQLMLRSHSCHIDKISKWFDDGFFSGDFHGLLYYETIDNIVGCLKNQPCYEIHCNLEQLLARIREDFKAPGHTRLCAPFTRTTSSQTCFIPNCYLWHRLSTVHREAYGEKALPTTFDIRDYFKSLLIAQQNLLSQVCQAVQLVLVMPSTIATSGRSFSFLHWVKSYLRNMILCQQRLMILQCLQGSHRFFESSWCCR